MAAARVSASRAAPLLLLLLLLTLLASILCCAGDPSPSRVHFADRWLPSSVPSRRRSSRFRSPVPRVPRVHCDRACQLEGAKACTVRPRNAGRRCGNELVRYSFIAATNSCVPFRYGGCRGNANNFLSFKQCSDRCKTSGEKRRKTSTRNRLPRRGSRIIFGGITTRRRDRVSEGQLVNRFGDGRKPPTAGWGSRRPIFFPGQTAPARRPPPKKNGAACFRPPRQSGRPCGDEPSVRYSYILATNSCVPFEFRGCGGSSNSFGTFSECRDLCKTAVAGDEPRRRPAGQCRLPWRAGPCRGFGSMMRYYYNGKRDACEIALYSGCGGNTNRFFSRQTCERTCRVG